MSNDSILSKLCDISKKSNVSSYRHASSVKTGKNWAGFGTNCVIGNSSLHAEYTAIKDFMRQRGDLREYIDKLAKNLHYVASNISQEKIMNLYQYTNGNQVNEYLNSIIDDVPHKMSEKVLKETKKIQILTTRWNNSDELCNSKPCMICWSMFKILGIRKISYSTDDRNIVTENLDSITPKEAYGIMNCVLINKGLKYNNYVRRYNCSETNTVKIICYEQQRDKNESSMKVTVVTYLNK